MTTPDIASIEDYTAIVAESPVWSLRDNALYWMDTGQKTFLRSSAPFRASERRELPYRASSFCLLPNGGFLIAYKKGIGVLDFESGRTRQLPLTDVDFKVVSFNDGACDRAGRFWVGTRHSYANEPVGALYCIDSDLKPRLVIGGLTVSNGLAWSPDSRTMYVVDSRPGRIHAYDFDLARGALSNPRVHIDYVGKGFRPDGCTVDAEGYLWVAEIDGWRVARYAPDGKQDREIRLPVKKPASVMFGGADMSTLFVSSISFGLTDEEKAAQPLAGKVMTIRLGVKGLAEPSFGRDIAFDQAA